jgi:U3 small nucleolar RNA-associated protein 6
MAEHVQAILDEMVAPLRDLQEREIFSDDEIHAIVQRRRSSEYLLRRRIPRKSDFLDYLQAEMNLEKLRKLRMKRRKRTTEQSEQQESESKRPGDKHILRHIHLLWTRTLRKYRSDMSLYLQYAEYLIEIGAFQKLSTLYANALQIFPHQVGLWIQAASHEFFHAGNIPTARVLLQRGLRMNKASRELWMQSFVLELHFVQKLVGRQTILLGKQQRSDDGQYELAKLVYDHAIQEVLDVQFRLQFLDQCRHFPDTQFLKEHILQTICDDHPTEPEAWIARAMHAWENPNGPVAKNQRSEKQASFHDPVLHILRRSTLDIPTKDMYLAVTRFLSTYVKEQRNKEEARKLLQTLYTEAMSSQELCASELVMDYVDFLVPEMMNEAIQTLESFVERKKMAPAVIWIRWAGLFDSTPVAIRILEKALSILSMDQPDYMMVMLQLFGAKLKEGKETTADCVQMLERILLLAPGFAEFKSIVDPPFGVANISEACLACLDHAVKRDGVQGGRNVYSKVLFQSGFAAQAAAMNPEGLKNFIDEAVRVENNCVDTKERKQRLQRIFDQGIKLFGKSQLTEELRHRLDDSQYTCNSYELDASIDLNAHQIPSLDVTSTEFSPTLFRTAFERYQVIHLRNVVTKNKKHLDWQNIGGLFSKLDPRDQDSWCVETKGVKDVKPSKFLGADSAKDRAYCSFLVQSDKEMYQDTVNRLPLPVLSWTDWSYEPAIWFFYGKNPRGNPPLEGRPEHTDSISHDGTWHYQVSGRKIWSLRPSSALLEHFRQRFPSEWKDDARLEVVCNQGDVLVVNTRLWFHRTTIPPQRFPSVSYARDFLAPDGAFEAAEPSGMSNVDGLYATNEIEEDTIVFTEKDMPNGELRRSSTNSNCQVVELDDGTSAVVSSRKIAMGEFFCVPPTDEESTSEDSKDAIESE